MTVIWAVEEIKDLVFIFNLYLFRDFLLPRLEAECKPKTDVKHVVLASMVLKGIGGTLLVFGTAISADLLGTVLPFFRYITCYLRLYLLHDFYDYGIDDPKFNPRLADSVQSNCYTVGCTLVFYWDEDCASKEVNQEEASKS